MRQRGTKVTDIALLVIAANDSVNVQTKEALKQIQDANLPYIVVINKIDLPNAEPDRVLKDLQTIGVLTEDWGGKVGVVKVSALTKEGFDELIERIFLEAEILNLTTNLKLPGKATVIESQLETGLGPIANIIVNDGTFKVGDIVICGEFFGKVKGFIDYYGKRKKEVIAGDSVKILGLSGVPNVGSISCQSKKRERSKEISS